MKTISQIPLNLRHDPSFEMADFIVSASNAEAHELVLTWPGWPNHSIALIGPEASGKSHLGHAWLKESSGLLFRPGDDVASVTEGAAVLVEDVDERHHSDETLFHLFNWVKEVSGTLLLTAKTPPNRWEISLPDLRSRLATLPVGEIQQPDDDLLMVLIVKLFSDRQLQVDMAVLNYVLPRIERSFAAVYDFVEKIDAAALAGKRRITRALAKGCLGL